MGPTLPSSGPVVAVLSSDAVADHNKLVVWLIAGILNALLFAIPATGLLLAARDRWPVSGTVLLAAWLLFYVSSLFMLFPATDGP
jgi:hypothetical protein